METCKTLNGCTTTDTVVIKKDGDTLTGKMAANALIAQNKAVGDIELPTKRKQKIKQAIEDIENQVLELIDSSLIQN